MTYYNTRGLPEIRNRWSLSPMECEVIRLYVEGHRNKDISEKLSLSPKTIATHAGRIRDKMDELTMERCAVLWDRAHRAEV